MNQVLRLVRSSIQIRLQTPSTFHMCQMSRSLLQVRAPCLTCCRRWYYPEHTAGMNRPPAPCWTTCVFMLWLNRCVSRAKIPQVEGTLTDGERGLRRGVELWGDLTQLSGRLRYTKTPKHSTLTLHMRKGEVQLGIDPPRPRDAPPGVQSSPIPYVCAMKYCLPYTGQHAESRHPN